MITADIIYFLASLGCAIAMWQAAPREIKKKPITRLLGSASYGAIWPAILVWAILTRDD